MDIKLVFVCVYIIVDFIYVVLSKDFYSNAVMKIQNSGIPSLTSTPLRIFCAIGAYVAMSVGWYFLAAGLADRWIQTKQFSSPYICGLLAGAIYGFALIGTYNLTNYIYFKNYDISVVIRDMSWGITWASLSVLLYVVYITNNKHSASK